MLVWLLIVKMLSILLTEYLQSQEELIAACDDVRGYGETLQAAAAQFSQSPCEPDNRTKMAKASKDLLLSVTRLMVVADMVDVHNLLEASSRVSYHRTGINCEFCMFLKYLDSKLHIATFTTNTLCGDPITKV